MSEETKEKKKLKLPKLKGLDDITFWLFVVSAILIVAGVALGSFVHGTIYIAILGAALFMIAIFIYIGSQLIGKRTDSVSSEGET